jgi:hypothetical protein
MTRPSLVLPGPRIINLGLFYIDWAHPPRILLSLSLFSFSTQPSAVIESKVYALHVTKKVRYLVSFRGNTTADILTDTRSGTEYVDSGMEDDTEKNTLQMIA